MPHRSRTTAHTRPQFPAIQPLFTEKIGPRITSYNVCYTKLLRLPDRSALYFVQRRIPGESLAQRVATQRLSLPQAIRIAVKLASLLMQLEQHRVLHRDIKPDNLMLDPEGELSFIDFGLATIPGLNWEPASSLPGTPSFLAPELYRGAPYGAQTELYAAGVTRITSYNVCYTKLLRCSPRTPPMHRPPSACWTIPAPWPTRMPGGSCSSTC